MVFSVGLCYRIGRTQNGGLRVSGGAKTGVGSIPLGNRLAACRAAGPPPFEQYERRTRCSQGAFEALFGDTGIASEKDRFSAVYPQAKSIGV